MARMLTGVTPRFRRSFLLAGLLSLFSLMGAAFGDGDERNGEVDQHQDEWKETTLDFGKDTVIAVSISPDGKTLAWGHGKSYATKARLAPISITDVESGKTIRRLRGHAFDVTAVRFVAGGKQLASGDEQGFLCLWDVATGKEIGAARPLDNMVRSVRASVDGKGFASAGDDGKVHLWGESLEAPQHSLVVDRVICLEACISPDGKTVAACSTESISVWSRDTGENIATTKESYDLVKSIDIAQDGKSMFAITARGNLIVFDYPTLRERANVRMMGTHEIVRSLPGTECIIGGSGGRLEVYDYAAKREIRVLSKGDSSGFGGSFSDLSTSTDGKLIVACHEKATKVWRRIRASAPKP